jgi:hypothetical protein
MIEQWVIDRLNPLKSESLIILADPQRMIRAGARAVDGWAKENGFTVLFCSGNLALREMYENLRDDPTAKLILVDPTRDKAKLPLFYPDLEARCKPKARLTITLRDFLTDRTGDQRWPLLVNTDRNIGRLILENLTQALRAHAQLRDVDDHHFTDSDLYKIVLGATLVINSFHKLGAGEITPKNYHQAGCRRSVILRDEEFRAVPELVKAMEQLDDEKFPKLMAYLNNPLSRRVRTNNHVERTNRMIRFFEKVRYKWRRRKTLVRFVVLKLDEIWGDWSPSRLDAVPGSNGGRRRNHVRDNGLQPRRVA